MLKRQFRLRQKSGFKTIFELGKNYSSKYVAIYVISKSPTCFGFIASKKVGNAVQRNRAKRLMREVIRLNLPKNKKSCTNNLYSESKNQRSFLFGSRKEYDVHIRKGECFKK